MSWELWQIVTFTFIFLFSVVFIPSQIIFLGSTETSFSFRLNFSPNRKRNVYQSWETSCQSDRPCAPGNGPPPPIRTTALHLSPLRTIPNLSSRHQDTPSLPPTTTLSLPPSPNPLPSTSPTARSTAATATPADCSSSTSEPGGTGMKFKREHGELKEGRKTSYLDSRPTIFTISAQQTALFVSFVSDTCCDSWEVTQEAWESGFDCIIWCVTVFENHTCYEPFHCSNE